MFLKILLLNHRYLEICNFACFSENRINLLSFKTSSQSFDLSPESFGILRCLKKLLVSAAIFCLRFLKRVSKNSLMNSKIYVWLCFELLVFCSKFKKNFVDFSLCSYQSHLLLIRISSVI